MASDKTYQPKIHKQDGGDTMTVESGGVIDILTGAKLRNNGVDLDLSSGIATSTSSTTGELDTLHSVTAGTVSASKALVVDANKDLTALRYLSLSTVRDSSDVARVVPNATAKTIANASATALFDVARASNVAAAGLIFYQAVVTDGTDYQSIAGMVSYAHVDKGGTGTFTITEVAGNQAKAVSTGTYTLAWTYVTGTAKGTVKLQPTSSLTATVHTVTYTVFPISGAITIL